jgi:hypothetical protein
MANRSIPTIAASSIMAALLMMLQTTAQVIIANEMVYQRHKRLEDSG